MTLSGRFVLFLVLGSLVLCTCAAGQVTSGNPIIRHIRSADPSAHVWNDGKVWIYASHDQDYATDYSTMDGYHVFSSFDLVNWTDHGEILHSGDVAWGNPDGGFMFAPSAAYKDGTYYFYFPHLSSEWQWRIGVATSDRPEGPFTDIGQYIGGTDNIDPACFMDDDGQAYLIWGGDSQPPKIARLRENMVELAEEPRVIDYGAGNFGEGPYMHKRDGIYYFSYTCHTCYPYQGYYAMGDNPYGPFEYKGALNPNPPGAQDHHSMVSYRGQWYYFYHVGNYNGGSLHRRNICIDSLHYNEDGTMRVVVQTTTGVGQDPAGAAPGILIPGRIEAEDFFGQHGTGSAAVGDTGVIVTGIHDSDWLEYVLEVLGSESYTAAIKISNPADGGSIRLLVDEEVIDTVSVDSLLSQTGGDTLRFPLFLHRGKHTLMLQFGHPDHGIDLMEVDWIELFGEKRYYSVSASATGGGSIVPEGTFFLEAGDSMGFHLDWGLYLRPDSLIIDGTFHEPVDTFIFHEMSGSHTVRAVFSPCTGTPMDPFVQANPGDTLDQSFITVFEGDDLVMKASYDDPGTLSWQGPGGVNSSGNTLEIDNIQVRQGGRYSAYLTDSLGCKSRLEFSVTVMETPPGVYQAEGWSGKSGVINDICQDAGNGYHLGAVNNGDWATYTIHIPEDGIYQMVARVSTATEGGTIELGTGEELLATIPVSGAYSDGWQDWYTTVPVETALLQGSHELKLTFRGGEGLLYNLNWFDLSFSRTIPVSTFGEPARPATGFFCYPLEKGRGIGIDYTLDEPSLVSIRVFNLAGIQTCTLIPERTLDAGHYRFSWNGTGDDGGTVPEGLYVVLFRVNNSRESRRVFLGK